MFPKKVVDFCGWEKKALYFDVKQDLVDKGKKFALQKYLKAEFSFSSQDVNLSHNKIEELPDLSAHQCLSKLTLDCILLLYFIEYVSIIGKMRVSCEIIES